MLDTNELVLAFSKFADTSYEEASHLSPLILAGAQEVLTNLKYGVDVETNNERLVQACAANAYCNYCMVKDLDCAQKVEIEGIIVESESKDRYKKAKEVKKAYMLMIADILNVSSAAFEGVSIDVK